MVNWKAVLIGIVAAFIIGLISGIGIPFTNLTLPILGASLTGLIAGGVAGYYARNGLGSGALHGFLATTIGGLLVALALIVLGTITAGVIGLSVGVFFLLLVASHGVPGAIGGAIGGAIAPEETTVGQPAT